MSQEKDILKYLKSHKRGITQRDAIELFGCYRLSARIADLRDAGWNIVTDREEGRNRYGDRIFYGRYRLLKGE